MIKDRIHLFLVENDNDHRELIHSGRILDEHVVTITAVSSLAEARAILQTIEPDIVISTIRLPDGNAVDFIADVQALYQVPFLMLTSAEDEAVAIAAKEKSGCDYVVKTEETLRSVCRIAEQVCCDWTAGASGREQRAKKSSRIGPLVTGIAHELNNKLTGVLGYAQLLLLTELSEKQRKYCGIVEQETLQGKKILESLLSFSHSAEVAAHRRQDITSVIKNACDRSLYAHTRTDIEMTSDISDGLPLVNIDAIQIEHMLRNVVTNAFEVLGDAGGRIHLSCYARKDTLQIDVTNTGPSIPEVDLERIFDPFFTTKKGSEGEGIGLSVSYGIVKEHNGQIYAVNLDGGGVKFVIEIPLDSNGTG